MPACTSEDFQADIESIAAAGEWAVTVREPAQVPRAFQQAFHLMLGAPGPVLIDLPSTCRWQRSSSISRFTRAAAGPHKPAATRRPGRESDRHVLNAAERPLINPGGGVINADASARLQEFAAEITGVPVIPT